MYSCYGDNKLDIFFKWEVNITDEGVVTNTVTTCM